MKGVIVSVNYADMLAHSLPKALVHLDDCLVVTTEADTKTHEVCQDNGCKFLCTEAFYHNGAAFNKARALEEGFDAIGRDGWMLILDADIMLPGHMPLPELRRGKLYSPHRLLADTYTDRWDGLKQGPDGDHFNGYFQLFHANDPTLVKRPWYDIEWPHAGGCDYTFQCRWSKRDKVRLRFKVLHVGPVETNWWGRGVDPAHRVREYHRLRRKFKENLKP